MKILLLVSFTVWLLLASRVIAGSPIQKKEEERGRAKHVDQPPYRAKKASLLRGAVSTSNLPQHQRRQLSSSRSHSMNHHFRDYPRYRPPVVPTRRTPPGQRRFRQKGTIVHRPAASREGGQGNEALTTRYRSIGIPWDRISPNDPGSGTYSDYINGPRPRPTSPPTQDWWSNVNPAAAVVAQCNSGNTGALWGPVPHVLTMDGLAFDIGGPGEFVLARNSDMKLHARVVSSTDRRLAHLTKSLALQYYEQTLEISLAHRLISGNTGMWGESCAVSAWWEGVALNLETNTDYGTVGALRFQTTQDFLEVSGGGLHVTVQPIESGILGCYLNIFVCFDEPLDSSLQLANGLLGGTPNGTPTDDWRASNGQVLGLPMNLRGQLAYEYATTNWCVDQTAQSLFPNAEEALQNCVQPYLGQINTIYASAAVKGICGRLEGVPSAWILACQANGVAGLQEEAYYGYQVMQQLLDARSLGGTGPMPTNPPIPAPVDTSTPTSSPQTPSPTTSTQTFNPTIPPGTTELPTPGVATEEPTSTDQPTPGVGTEQPTPGIGTEQPTPGVGTEQPTATPETSEPTSTPTSSPTTPRTEITYGLQPDCYDMDPSKFNICLDLSSESGQVEDWFALAVAAKERWERIIANDPWGPWEEDYIANNMPPGFVGTSTPQGTIDDMYISVFIENIDGPNGLNALAGPDVLTSQFEIAAASIQLDPNDIAIAIENNYFEYLMIHEMGHCMGIGPLWPLFNFVQNGNYVGDNGIQGWRDIGCTGQLPVDGGSHWDENCLGNEIMTPTLRFNQPAYLSAVTMGALRDLGYEVNPSEQDKLELADLGNCGNSCPAAGTIRRLGSPNITRTTYVPAPRLSDEGELAILRQAVKRFATRDKDFENRKLSGSDVLRIDTVSLLYYEDDNLFSRVVHRRDVEHLMG